MKTYTVKEITQIVHTNPETVRRWIRDGKLKAIKDPKTGENIITEADLCDFLSKNPKYSGYLDLVSSKVVTSKLLGASAGVLAGLSANKVAGIGLAASTLMFPLSMAAALAGGTAIALIKQSINNKKVSHDELRNFASLSIIETESKIKNKEDEIKELEMKLKKAKSDLKDYKNDLSDLQSLMKIIDDEKSE